MTTLQEQRVAVARDALAMVRDGKFKVIPDSQMTEYERYENGVPCGCAVGLLSIVMDSRGIPILGKCELRLKALWPQEEAEFIEGSFEGWGWEIWREGTYNDEPRAWESRFPDRRDRLIAILQNIIRNNGTFIPSDIQPIEADINTLDFKDHTPALRPVAV